MEEPDKVEGTPPFRRNPTCPNGFVFMEEHWRDVMKVQILAMLCVAALAGCNDQNDAAEDKLEREAEASAAAAGPIEAALGLSEAQLLGADLLGPNNIELGDVARVERGPDVQASHAGVAVEAGPGTVLLDDLLEAGHVNPGLIGPEVEDWRGILADPAASLHLYGKREARPGRKMGHVTRLIGCPEA